MDPAPTSISVSSPGTNGFGSGSARGRETTPSGLGFRQRATVSGGIGLSRYGASKYGETVSVVTPFAIAVTSTRLGARAERNRVSRVESAPSNR